MYPASDQPIRSNRSQVEDDLASFWAGTQFRVVREITLASEAEYVIRFDRAVDVVIRGFTMSVTSGEVRCEVYRGPTFGGTFSDIIPVLPKNGLASRPEPIYQTQSTVTGGGTISGGTLYDVLDVKTANSTAQSSTIRQNDENMVGAPGGSSGGYKFSNPSNSSSTCIFTMWWEELPNP